MKHQPRKRFGQNFLRDEGVVDAIAHAVAPAASDHIVEIGPGEGALTSAMIGSGCRLDAIELDRDLNAGLLAAFSIHSGFTLHSGDALRFHFERLVRDGYPLRIVGNLPYNISTPLIIRLLEHKRVIQDMHFMLQLEVVERLAAAPGSKLWGRLGVLAQYHCEVEALFEVPPEAFYPSPKVQSAVVRLIPHKTPRWSEIDEAALGRCVALCFAQRRKTLRNNLKGHIDDKTLLQLGIDPGARAETLTIDQFIALAHLVPPTSQQD